MSDIIKNNLDVLFCPYHLTTSPINDFCCDHSIKSIAVDNYKRLLDLNDELMALKEKLRWIPVSERLPDNNTGKEFECRRKGWPSTDVIMLGFNKLDDGYFQFFNEDWERTYTIDEIDSWREVPNAV